MTSQSLIAAVRVLAAGGWRREGGVSEGEDEGLGRVGSVLVSRLPQETVTTQQQGDPSTLSDHHTRCLHRGKLRGAGGEGGGGAATVTLFFTLLACSHAA